MAGDQLQVVITGKDGVSRVFQEVGRNADAMGKSIEQAAKNAGSGLNSVDASSQKAARSLRDFDEAGRTVGTGLGAIAASFVLYSQSVAANEQMVASLGRTYGDAAQQLVSFADQIQASSIFSNDQALEAANIFGTLARNYGVTTEQVQQLIQVSADLAAVNGTSLADAAQRVQAAIRGEGESAEALGLTMNQAAIDVNGLTLSMSNADAAQFRFNALMEQSTFATGAAADQAQTTTGQVRELANEVQDAAQHFAAWTGPVSEVAAGLGSFGIEAGLAVGGLAQLARGMGQASEAAGGFFTALRAGGTLTKVAIGGGVVAALGLAVYGAMELSDAMKSNLEPAMAETKAQAGQLDTTIGQLAATMSDASLAFELSQGVQDIEARRKALEEYKKQLDIINNPQYPQGLPPGASADEQAAYQQYLATYAAAQQAVADLTNQYGDLEAATGRVDEAQDALGAILSNTGVGAEDAMRTAVNLFDAYEAGQITFDQLVDSLNGVVADLANYDAKAIKAAASTEQLTAAVAALTNAQYEQLEASRASTQILSTAEGEKAAADRASLARHEALTAASHQLTETLESQAAGYREAAAASRAYTEDGLTRARDRAHDFYQASINVRNTLTGISDALLETSAPFVGMEQNTRAVGAELNFVAQNTRTFTEVLDDNFQSGLANWHGQEQALLDYKNQLLATVDAMGGLTTAQQLQAAGLGGQSVDVAVNLQAGGGNLEDVQRVIIGQTNAMSQQLEGVGNWADKLIGDPGTWTELDNLLAEGRISLEQYTAAQDAQISISQDVANAQRDLLAVQAGLAPVIADATSAQADYIASLADMDSQSQLAALGFMDQAESAQALSVAQLIAASTTDAMQASTSAAVAEMAAADPVMAAMLEKMGLISIGADGTITVNFDSAEGANDAIENLTESIDALIVALGGIPPAHIDVGDVGPAKESIDNLKLSIDDIPDDHTTMVAMMGDAETAAAAGEVRDEINTIPPDHLTVFQANDLASGPAIGAKFNVDSIPESTLTVLQAINNVDSAVSAALISLGSIDGKRVTTYIDTVTTLSKQGARDGGVLGYANGGMVLAEMGEAGGELLRFRNGGEAYVPNPGIYLVEQGTSVLPAPATAATLAGRRGGGNQNFFGSVVIQPPTANVYDAISSNAIRRGR